MNFERSRLRTFQSWPSNSPVSSKRIAKAGFFYTGHQHEVQCFACGVKISDWNYNDSVMAKHRAKDPGCPFVKNPEASGNVSIENEENYKQVSGRLATFNNWPVSFIVTPESLSKTGFYYLKQGDKVKCAYCNIIVGRWEPGDIAEVEHRRQSPNCPFLARDKPNQSNMINLRALDEDMRDLGVQNHRVPKHPNLATFDSRLLTFASWPRDNPLGPQNLAVAGFFYDGRGDQVRCFHCDGGLLKWTAGDEPWSEHARWFPECHFVMLVKGEQFIENTIKANPPITSADVFLNHKFYTKAPNKRSKVTNEQVQEFMNSPPAIAALQMGLDSSRVKTAIRQRLESSGYSFSSAESLMEAALDVQFDENNDADDVGERRLTRPQCYYRPLVIVLLSTVGRRTRAQSLHKGRPMTILQTLKRKRVAVLNLWPLLTLKGESLENRGDERKKKEEERKREKEEWWWMWKRVRRVEKERMRIQMLLWCPVSQHSMRIIRTKAWRMRYVACERPVCARSVWTRRWVLFCYRADIWLRVLSARPVCHAVLYVVRILRLQCERSCLSNIWLRALSARPVCHAVLYVVRILRLQCEKSHLSQITCDVTVKARSAEFWSF